MELTTHQKETKVLKNFIEESVKELESGETVRVSGGYRRNDFESSTLDRHCGTIVQKLTSLGYAHTTNHGHGCRDYTFMKKIEL